MLGKCCQNMAIPFGVEKLEWLGYRIMKNFKDGYVYAFGQTDGQTLHDG